MVKGFLNGFHDKFDIHNWRCFHRFATEFYSWFTEKGDLLTFPHAFLLGLGAQ